MDRNSIARELIHLGKSDAKLIAKLESNRERRCELLQSVACHPDAGLDPDIAPMAVEPKEP